MTANIPAAAERSDHEDPNDTERETWLYRIFGRERVLLYVGIGYEPVRRWVRHARRSWWDEMCEITVERFPTRAEAARAEERAVRLERPIHNVIYAVPSPDPLAIGGRLRELRCDHGLTGAALAARLGWSQPKISRVESSRYLPSRQDVEAWARACGASNDDVDELVDLLQSQSVTRQENPADSSVVAPAERHALLREAALIRTFDPIVMPRMLWLDQYARSAESQIADAVRGRAHDRDLTYDENRQFQFAITEAALWQAPCSREILINQMHYLIDRSYDPRITVAILPFGKQLSFVPGHTFTIFGNSVITSDMVEDRCFEGPQAAIYHHAMDLTLEQAVTGEDARRLVVRAMEEIRAA